ncbi:hypothetical protein D9M71_728810 [compost metagenome]
MLAVAGRLGAGGMRPQRLATGEALAGGGLDVASAPRGLGILAGIGDGGGHVEYLANRRRFVGAALQLGQVADYRVVNAGDELLVQRDAH